MTPVPDCSTFETASAGQAPWDIGKPQKAFIDVADQITGSILDAGCGTGDSALFFASRGHKVTGIDFLEEPILRAKTEGVVGGGAAAGGVRLLKNCSSVLPSRFPHASSKQATRAVILSLPPRSFASATSRSQARRGSGSSCRMLAIRASGTISVRPSEHNNTTSPGSRSSLCISTRTPG
jgi:SAM-dependent methyltransferase